MLREKAYEKDQLIAINLRFLSDPKILNAIVTNYIVSFRMCNRYFELF